VIEDALAKTLIKGQPVPPPQIDPRLPFLGAVVFKRHSRAAARCDGSRKSIAVLPFQPYR